VGIGYVGLPLAAAFGRVRPTLAYDLDATRIEELSAGIDRTGEVDADELADASHLAFSADPASLAAAGIYIVAVPTPIDAAKQPDFGPLLAATEAVGRHLSRGDLVIYESTVYPGATEEVCVPILEERSGLAFNVDFAVGYSPERINPGDRAHRLDGIVKVTSGSTPEAAEAVDALYRQVVAAGTHRAPSIRVAEAAKVIENTQRDVNIALINELAVLFSRLDLDTHDVLEAAGTKWNFLPFTPGLVGGHCIGVDPYYLTHKALSVDHHPEVMLAGRRINDSMGRHVAERVVLEMTRAGVSVGGARCLLLGLAFKENCPDLRNTGVLPVIECLREFGMQVDVCDPRVDPREASKEYGIELLPLETALAGAYDAAVLAVAHSEFDGIGPALRVAVPGGVVFDVKGVLPRDCVDGRL
ncbi:MAG: nucleotide sugar dehydrogenase, partial [Candidatus Nanopelagicales bacterium]